MTTAISNSLKNTKNQYKVYNFCLCTTLKEKKVEDKQKHQKRRIRYEIHLERGTSPKFDNKTAFRGL